MGESKRIDFKSNEVDLSDEYIARWRPLIEQLAARSQQLSVNYDFDDRVQDGMIGLWRAVNSYNREKNPDVPLVSWIYMKMRWYMLDGSIRESGRGGGGYTYGHVIHMEDMARRSNNGEKRDETVEDIFSFFNNDPIEEAFEDLESLEQRDKLKERLTFIVASVKDGDLLLANIYGKRMKDIGLELGISESAISLRIKIARERVRQQVKSWNLTRRLVE